MLGCGLLRLLSDVYVCSSLSLLLCIFLGMSGCLFRVVLCFLGCNQIVLYFLHELVSSQSICQG